MKIRYLNVVNYSSLNRSDHFQLLREKDKKIRHLSFELEQLKRALFGSKSERFINSAAVEQLELFAALERQITELQEEQISYTRKKVKRTKLPEHLERVETVLQPNVDVSGMQKLGEAVQEKLAFAPAKVYVKKTVRPKYKDSQGTFHIVELPPDPFPKNIASRSLAAHVAVNKYVDHQPLYRQSKIWARQSID